MLGYARGIGCSARSRRRTMTCSRRESRRPEEEELGDDEARAVPDGKAVDAGQSASHVGCISNSQATRSDDESRSVGEGRAHHDDDEERPRRLAVAPSMLGYTKASAAASLAAGGAP